MALFVNDVKYISSTKNLSDFSVPASAVSGYQLPSVAEGFVIGAVYAYSARSSDGLFESGTGINDGNSQARTTINDGSSGPGVKVDFVTFPTVVITVLRDQIGNLEEDNTWLGENTFSNISSFDDTVTLTPVAPTITGPELISNPTFLANSTGWTIGDAQTVWTPGHFTTNIVTSSLSSNPWVSTPVSVSSGQWYAIAITQTVSDDESIAHLFPTPSGGHTLATSNGVTGNYTFYLQAPSTNVLTLTIDFDFYTIGAARDLTSVSMKACTPPTPALTILDSNLQTLFEIGGIDDARSQVIIGQNALPSRGCPGAVAIGAGALFSATEGVSNVVIGRAACYYSTTGHDNTVIGNFAASNMTEGFGNTIIGSAASYFNTTGAHNTTMGVSSGNNITTGSNNVVIGGGGLSLVTADGAIIIGEGMDSDGDTDRYLNIGNEIFGVMGSVGINLANGATVGAEANIALDGLQSAYQAQGGTTSKWFFNAFGFGNNSQGAGFAFSKTRDTVVTGQTIVATGDILGYFDWYGSDGVTYRDGANLRVKVDGSVSAGNLGARFEFMTRPPGGSMTIRQIIDSSGNITFGAVANVVIDTLQSVGQIQGTNTTFHQSLVAYGNNVGGGSLVFYKTRNASPGTQTAVSANDTLGYLDWYGTDGTNQIDGANLRVRVDGAVSSGNLGGKLEILTRPAGGSMTQRLSVAGAGYVTMGAAANIVIDTVNSISQVQGSNTTFHHSLVAYGNNQGGGSLVFYKTRNADPTVQTTVNANDTLGYLDWYGTDGTNQIDGANMRVRVDGTVASGSLGGKWEVLTRPAGGSMTLRLVAPGAGGLVIGNVASALSTAATDGFLYIPTCAGTPTGTPTTQTGTVALVYDTTNNKFYIYNGAWKGGTAPGVWS